MNKIDLTEALIAIADTGSINQAAKKLHQTNAAISKKLTKLETYLGTQLVHRARAGLTLTESGQHYYHEAKKALVQFVIAENMVTQTANQPKGTLKIVSNQYYVENIILPKLSRFIARYPDLKINIDVAEILPDFNSKKMDILFGVSSSGEDHLVRKRIESTRYVLCASPNYLKQYGKPNSTSELLKHNFIAHSERKHNDTIILDDNEKLTLEPKLLFNNTQLIVQAALLNMGFIWTHENLISHLISKKKLICVLEKFTQQPINIYAYYEHQLHQDPKIKVFMDFFSNGLLS